MPIGYFFEFLNNRMKIDFLSLFPFYFLNFICFATLLVGNKPLLDCELLRAETASSPHPQDTRSIFKLYIIVLVFPNFKMNPPQVYMCSPS